MGAIKTYGVMFRHRLIYVLNNCFVIVYLGSDIVLP